MTWRIPIASIIFRVSISWRKSIAYNKYDNLHDHFISLSFHLIECCSCNKYTQTIGCFSCRTVCKVIISSNGNVLWSLDLSAFLYDLIVWHANFLALTWDLYGRNYDEEINCRVNIINLFLYLFTLEHTQQRLSSLIVFLVVKMWKIAWIFNLRVCLKSEPIKIVRTSL